jgi:hypothetical protein
VEGRKREEGAAASRPWPRRPGTGTPAGVQGGRWLREGEGYLIPCFEELYSSNPREGGHIELAIHEPLCAVQGHMGHSHTYTLTSTVQGTKLRWHKPYISPFR